MMPEPERIDLEELEEFVARIFSTLGLERGRARRAASALCYGDLCGLGSHGVRNLTRIYVPLLESARADPGADLSIVSDRGAAVLTDARRSLGLWSASEAMDLAVARARRFGIGLVACRGSTHIGCAGYHAARAAAAGMLGLVLSNCGGQRIAPPPGGRPALLGTNPLSFAAPAAPDHPFVLDMSTTVVPTGRIRVAEAEGRRIPEGWLESAGGDSVTDPAEFDRGRARLLWLGSRPETGAYKGYGLGLLVEVMTALLAGATAGPSPDGLAGDGRPGGRDDDIGVTVLAVDAGGLRTPESFLDGARTMFDVLLACPPSDGAPTRVAYPGWHEARLARRHRAGGVPVPTEVLGELRQLGRRLGVTGPKTRGAG